MVALTIYKQKTKKGEDFQNGQNAIKSTPPIFHLSEKSKNLGIQAFLGHSFTIHAIAHLTKK